MFAFLGIGISSSYNADSLGFCMLFLTSCIVEDKLPHLVAGLWSLDWQTVTRCCLSISRLEPTCVPRLDPITIVESIAKYYGAEELVATTTIHMLL